MTFARIVRLIAILAIVTGISAWRHSLFAQSQGDARQYDPAYDGAPGSPDQGDWGDIPAYVSAISGEARLSRDSDETGDFEQVPLQVGDQIRTTRGRVEVLYNDGSVVALDEYSSVTIDADSTWRLHTGRMKVVSRNNAFAVDAAPVGMARLRYDGDYRITLAVNRRSEPEVEVAVTRGSADLENRLGRTLVRAGTRALTTEGYAPSVPYAFAAPSDDFERWTNSQAGERYGVTSVRYLPSDLRNYGGYFDRDGYWSQHHSHGWVWYPRVAVGWEPFHSGRWSFVIGFGYNWIGRSRWEWPTHHYGRWDRYGSNWFWIPSRASVPWRRVGYSAPRRSFNVSVSYYNRPQSSRVSPSYRGSTSSRSRIVEAPRGDDRRPNAGSYNAAPQPAPQQRTAIPRSSAGMRDPNPSTRPSTFPSSRPSSSSPDRTAPNTTSRGDGTVFQRRQAPSAAPREVPQMNRPARASSSSSPDRPTVFSRERRPTAQPQTPQRPEPSAQAPSRPSRSEARPPATRGGMSDPNPSSARPPAGSRTPSSSSRPQTGSASRRGGGG
jgi:hypothetical protein